MGGWPCRGAVGTAIPVAEAQISVLTDTGWTGLAAGVHVQPDAAVVARGGPTGTVGARLVCHEGSGLRAGGRAGVRVAGADLDTSIRLNRASLHIRPDAHARVVTAWRAARRRRRA